MALPHREVDTVRRTPSPSVCFPVTDAETEEANTAQAHEPMALTDNQTQVGIHSLPGLHEPQP